MTYVKQTWANAIGGGTPINAARLNYIESGIEALNGVGNVVTAVVGDNTANINNALTAAGANGRVILPQGEITIAGRVSVTGSQSLIGAGGGWVGSASTTLKCTAVGAGLDVTGGNGGEVSNFLIDADNLAAEPFRRLLDAGLGGGFKEFRNVYVFDSALDGMNLLGPQNDTYINCSVSNSTRDNLTMDRGTGGTVFVNWEDFSPGRYGIYINKLLVDGPYAEPQQNSFHGGRTEFPDPGAASMLYMRGGQDIVFNNFAFVGGNNLSGATIDIDQSLASVDLSTAQSVSGTGVGDSGACIKLTGVGRKVHLGRHWFVGGHTSLYLATTNAQMAAGLPQVYAEDGLLDGTSNGMRALDFNAQAILRGRNGPWIAPTLLNSWVNETVSGYPNAGYRITSDGELEIRGGIKSGASGTVAFQVPIGYRPVSPGLFVTRTAACAGGLAHVRLSHLGDILVSQITGTITDLLWLDGLTFPLRDT